MPIVENGRNVPSRVGRKNLPTERPWPAGRRLADLPSARGIGREPPLLPQLTKYPIVPLLDRPKPVLQWVRTRNPIVPRVKILGAFGLVSPQLEIGESRPIGSVPHPLSILSGPRQPLSAQESALSVEW